MEMKQFALLYCLESVLVGRRLNKDEIVSRFSLSDPAFEKYKKRIRQYLSEFHPELELTYKKKRGTYYVFSKK